nr:hypothetical protein [Tanacetum cinerariifolium]
MSIQDIEDLKQQYLDEIKSLINEIQIKDYRNERIDIRFRRECEIKIDELKGNFNRMSIEVNKKKELRTIPLNEIVSQIPPSNAITPVLPTIEDPEDSLIMRNEDFSTIPKKESDEFIKSSVEDLVPIPSESEDTFGNDSECDLPSYDDFSPINDPEGKSVTFSNPLFDSNDDFTSSVDESLSDEDDLVPIPSESEDTFGNDSECDLPSYDDFSPINDPEGKSDGYHDSEGDVLYLEILLSDDTTPNLPLEVFLDGDPRSLNYEDSRGHGFVHRLLKLQSLAYGTPIS